MSKMAWDERGNEYMEDSDTRFIASRDYRRGQVVISPNLDQSKRRSFGPDGSWGFSVNVEVLKTEVNSRDEDPRAPFMWMDEEFAHYLLDALWGLGMRPVQLREVAKKYDEGVAALKAEMAVLVEQELRGLVK